MTHPASNCREAARLQRAWYDRCRRLNNVPEDEHQSEFASQRADDAVMAALDAYQRHIETCPVCKQAMKEMEAV